MHGSERSGALQLWLRDRDGGNLRQLTSLGPSREMELAWSPKGDAIAFFSDASGGGDVYVIDVAGGSLRQLTAGSVTGGQPIWSGDGDWIFFTSHDSTVWTVLAEGGEAVATNVPRLGSESADGKSVYWTEGVTPDFVLWMASVDGGEPIKVLDSIAREEFVVTADGVYYIGVDLDEDRASWSLNYYELESGTITSLAPVKVGTGHGLDLSRDGRTLLYTQADEEGADLMMVSDFH